MRILSVEKNESVCIGNEIQVFVRRILKSGDVELGIKAPKKIFIHREEFIETLKKLKMQLESLK
jgi:carbon storage regulator CsrA